MIIDITTDNNSISMSVDIANLSVAELMVQDTIESMDKYLNTGYYTVTVRKLYGIHTRYTLTKQNGIWHRRHV